MPWLRTRSVMYQLFASSHSVEHALLQRGVPLTDAPPELFEELVRVPKCRAERMRPAVVREWFHWSAFAPDLQAALQVDHRFRTAVFGVSISGGWGFARGSGGRSSPFPTPTSAIASPRMIIH